MRKCCANNTVDKDWLYEQYITNGKTRYEISDMSGLTPGRIGTLLQQYGIKRYSVSRHGLVKHPLNAVWNGMKERCSNPLSDNYKWYGGIGISVCDEWQQFKPFYDWAMANGWEPGLTVDRIDGSKNYCPENCRLISHQQQCRNRTSNVHITVDGITHLQCEWEEILGLKHKIIAKWKYRHGIDYVIDQLRDEISRRKEQI